MAVNHLAHFQLANLLTPILIKSAPARVTIVSSAAHVAGSSKWLTSPSLGMKASRWNATGAFWLLGVMSYGDSKLANILHAQEYHRRYSKQGVSAASLHPGEILTNIVREERGVIGWIATHGTPLLEWVWPGFIDYIFKTEAQGAATQVYVALRGRTDMPGFYADCNMRALFSPWHQGLVNDAPKLVAFWEASQGLVDAALTGSNQKGR